MALATVPLLLFLLALLPRVWAPDLVPYGPIQAALIADAASRAGTSWLHVYAAPAFPVAALVDPLLRDLPAPVGAWIVLRALLDSFGVAILYLAIGRVLNRGAALLAASIYALDPALWATTRDPAGSLAGLIVAAGLLAAVRAIRRPTPINGIVLGLALALLVRHFPPGWGFVLAGALTLALARASWITGSVTALAMLAGAGPAIWARPFAVVPGLASVADGWRPVLGSFAWLPSESALPGTVALDSLIAPAAVLALVLALSGTIHALIYAWKTPPSVLVLPIWALLTTLSMAWLALPGAGNAATAAAIVPVLAGLVVVPIAVSTWTSLRWATGLAIVLLLGIGTVTFALNLVGIERASHERAGFGAARLAADTPGSGPIAVRSQLGLHEVPTEQRSLRTWQALADTIQATSERTGATDVVSLADDDRLVPLLASLLRGSPAVRRLPPGVSVLPLTRETVFLLMPDTPVPVELTRPSSTLAVFASTGEDTGARLATLRARPATDWLARAVPVQGVRFTDGSAVVGVVADRGGPGRLNLTLFWELPAAADGRSLAQTARVTIRGNGPPVQQAVRLPPVEDRRAGELVVQQVPGALAVPIGPDLSVAVALRDATGTTIATRAGAAEAIVLTRQSAVP